ncbi:hypothetical protein AAVH_23690, partial [Aphelenchoides avenae]
IKYVSVIKTSASFAAAIVVDSIRRSPETQLSKSGLCDWLSSSDATERSTKKGFVRLHSV